MRLTFEGTLLDGRKRKKDRNKKEWMNKIKFATILLLCTAFLFSCMPKYTLNINSDYSGTVNFEASIDESVAKVIKNMQAMGKSNPQASGNALFINAQIIADELKKNPSLSQIKIDQKGAYAISGNFHFKDFNTLFLDKSGKVVKGIFQMSKNGSKSNLSFSIDKTKAKYLTDMLPGIDPEVINVLQAPAIEDEAMTEAEYIDMLQGVFGKKNIDVIKNATITCTVTVDGKLNSQLGGIAQANTVVYKLSVLQALVLERPIEYKLEFTK